MFERFSDDARRVVVVAQEEARLLDHNYIGTEHILLALVHEDEYVAAHVLQAMGVSLTDVRAQVEEIIGRGSTAPSGHIPFTPRAKKVLEFALREALQFGHTYIGTEHLLLGIVREGEGVAARVLLTYGADLSSVRHEVVALLSAHPREPERPVAQAASLQQVAVLRAEPGFGPPAARCSFCGRSEDRVAHLLVAGGMSLCDQCARAAVTQLDELPDDAPKRARFRRGDVGLPDERAAIEAIERAFEAAIGPAHVPPAEALWAVEGGAELESLLVLLDSAAARAPVVVNDSTVERVRFVDADEAEVSLGIWMAGSTTPMLHPAHAVLEDGTWKVSRSTVEFFARLAQQFARPPD
jgi:hypothetical protein